MSYSDQRLRFHIRLSQAIKALFAMMPKPTGWAFRWLFLSDEAGALHWASRRVLAHLAHFCFADRSIYGGTAGTNDSAFMLGVREGRRQVWLEIMKYLHLDENQVRAIKEQNDE